jgi:hypothetical protein
MEREASLYEWMDRGTNKHFLELFKHATKFLQMGIHTRKKLKF